MMRKVLSAMLILLASAVLPAVSFDLRGGLEWSYDTNAFSDPLPLGYDPAEGFPNGGEFIRRMNIGMHASADIYFEEDSRFGLSTFLTLRFPYFSQSVLPDGSGYDWEYRTEDSLSRQHTSLFCGIGPVFRYSTGRVDILLPIRFSIGSYDWFTSGVVMGVSIEPGINVFLTDDVFLSFALTYDAHLVKLFLSMNQVYDPGYIMLTCGAYAGAGFRFGGADA